MPYTHEGDTSHRQLEIDEERDVESVDDMRDEFDPATDCHCCQGTGEVPTADYESYFGAMMKPCPVCHGTTDAVGHGRLS